MTYSRMICFTTVTHLINHKVIEVWAAMHKIYQMYMLRGFHFVEIAGNEKFAWIADQVASLPTNLGWEFGFLVPISGTPIGSGILDLFPIPKIPVRKVLTNSIVEKSINRNSESEIRNSEKK
jgi:hypothetical protein